MFVESRTDDKKLQCLADFCGLDAIAVLEPLPPVPAPPAPGPRRLPPGALGQQAAASSQLRLQLVAHLE
jgi:hypothetical protein